MAELTQAEALGVGLEFLMDWDFEVVSGSIGTIDGIDILARDLSFGLQQELGEERGKVQDPDTREDIKIVAKDVLDAADRIRSYTITNVEAADDGRTIRVRTEAIANTGDRGEFILIG